MSTAVTTAPAAGSRRGWKNLPLLRQVQQSVGLQRGMLVAGLVLSAFFVLVAIFAPLLAPYEYNQLRDPSGAFGAQQAPSSAHWLGTTVGGYDVLSRVIWGSRTALYVIVVAIAISGGESSLWGGIMAAAIAITVVFIPQYFRVVRAETVRVKAEAFVESAKVIGASHRRIMFRHVLRNATRTLPLILTLNASEAVSTLAALGFLGFGIESTSASEWGYDLQRALADVSSGIWWTSVFPGLAIVLVVLGLTLVGEGLNDLADPRLRTRRRAVATAADVGETSVVPGGTLGAGPGGLTGLEGSDDEKWTQR